MTESRGDRWFVKLSRRYLPSFAVLFFDSLLSIQRTQRLVFDTVFIALRATVALLFPSQFPVQERERFGMPSDRFGKTSVWFLHTERVRKSDLKPSFRFLSSIHIFRVEFSSVHTVQNIWPDLTFTICLFFL